MIPLQKILSRIKWDKKFGEGNFSLGYYDRVESRIINVPFKEIHFNDENKFSFLISGRDGEDHTIPFHRVKEIYRNGELIWKRPR